MGRTRRQRSASRERARPKEFQETKETITVHASDYRKYSKDVNMLRNCKIEDRELSPRSHAAEIGSRESKEEEDYIHNPWAGKTKHLHELLSRESQDESGINQKWFPPPTATGRYETPSPGPKRRQHRWELLHYGSDTSTRTSSPATDSPTVNLTPRKHSRPRSRAPSPGAQQQQMSQLMGNSNLYSERPGLPPRSPLDSCRRRRSAHSAVEGRADSRGRQAAVPVTAALETSTVRLPPRLPPRTGTPNRREYTPVACR